MKKLAAAILLCASTATAGPSILSPRRPFPPAGETGVALCAGEDPCNDLDYIQFDLAQDCWVCATPITSPWEECAAAPAIEAVGPVYIGEGSVSPCDGCAAAGAGDLIVRGGRIYTTAAGGINEIGPCTVDGADSDSVYLTGGGAIGGAGSRGGNVIVDGNDQVGGGDVGVTSGNAADSEITINCFNENEDGGVHLIQELAGSANQNRLDIDHLGATFSGPAGEDVLIQDPLNLYAAATRAETLCNAAFDMTANPSSAFWAGQHGSELGYYTDGAFTAGCTTSWGDNLATWTGDMVMRADTADGADDSTLHLYGGGAGNSDRGASLRISGNEDGGNAGWLEGFTGTATGAGINFGTFGATSTSFSVDVDTTPPADWQNFTIGSGAAHTGYSFSFSSQSGKPIGLGEDMEIEFEGATADADETTLGVIDPTNDNAIDLPDESGVIITSASAVALHGQRVLRAGLPSGGSFTLIEDTAYFVFLGRTTVAFTPKHVEFYVAAGGTGAQTAEVGFFSSVDPPDKGSQTLTKIVASGTVGDLTTTGVKRNTSAFSTSVPAGTYLWAGIRTAMATNEPAIVGLGSDWAQGLVTSTATAGALTGAGPWTGAIIAASASPVSPALSGVLD